MGFNLKKARVEYEHEDALLENNRKDRGHVSPESGTIEKNLDQGHTGEEPSISEKRLQKHHTEAKDKAAVTEARLDREEKRDDRTHHTNTLPINELAEEAQMARLKARGETGIDKDHFQQYKKEDLGLSKENFARLSRLDGINRQIDKLWMASSWDRLTTAEKKSVRMLLAERNKLIRS